VSPDIPGLELAGEMVAVGPGDSRFAPGDRTAGGVGTAVVQLAASAGAEAVASVR
jgi:NADPH:quinone reductase-like Zn-dependent oxidoreductase